MDKTNYRPSFLQAKLIENLIKDQFGWHDQHIEVHHVIEDRPYRATVQIVRRIGFHPNDIINERVTLRI